eukprot:s1365_g19.t1
MEVLVEAAAGIPSDAVLSLRLGPTRRQAPLLSALSHPFRFATALDDACQPLCIDVLRPLATAQVAIRAEELRYSLPLDGCIEDMAVRLKVKPAKPGKAALDRDVRGGPAEKLSASLKDSTAVTRDYLERHKLLQYIQSMLHAVIQAKPHDPFPFMMAQLAAACARPSRRARRHSCPSPAQPPKEVTGGRLDLELASDPGCVPSVASTTSGTPLDIFSDPGCHDQKEVNMVEESSMREALASLPWQIEAPPKPAVQLEVQRRPSAVCKPDGFRYLRTGLHLQRRTSADGKGEKSFVAVPPTEQESIAIKGEDPKELISEDSKGLQHGEQYDELARLRGNLRQQLEEAVEDGKLVSAVEKAVSLMTGQEDDDEVRIRRELVQLKIEHKELSLYSDRLKRDLRELRRVNLDLRRRLAQLSMLSRPDAEAMAAPAMNC